MRKLPCACCQAPAGDLENPMVAAHVDHAGGKGVGTKVADRHCVPLCAACHKRQHNVGWMAFEKALPMADAVALSSVYWIEWPARVAWERDLSANAEHQRGALA
ncbi:hypothetical protein [Sphingomonas sp. GC_Shp_3]|uniref:hypothetical protein n=1 Tax=Sphingomonas sp. GC_Shp_3 TaxID=2937383 RepID=UPI002269FC4A|nr:hypothetical protein [Sphingomonas sp. GC_Shp_3]